jgi:cation transport ATPase
MQVATKQKKDTMSYWEKKSPIALVIYISICAFIIYSCMYLFRKPYTVSLYENKHYFGISYKVLLVITQVIGYMCSKFYGIKFISGLQHKKRAFTMVVLIAMAWLSLLLFAIIPAPYNIFCMFLNGLPLGLIFGLVFGFLEGRRTTEIMGAILAGSFIFASGFAKTVGKWILLKLHVTDWWMPFTAGAMFILPLFIFVYFLNKVPPPNEDDIAKRTIRVPMTNTDRKNFSKQFFPSLLVIIIAYTIFTIVRDFCEDFSNELWIETGYANNKNIFVKMNTIVTIIVLFIIGTFFLIKNNYKALRISHFIVVLGLSLSICSTFLFNLSYITPFVWMLVATTGMYLAYIPFNCLFFERMIATYKINGNIGFVMYTADAFGYLGTVTVLLIKEFIPISYSWVNFFSFLFYVSGILGIVLLSISLITHHKLFNKWNKNQQL